jgi:uncharacterized protein (DUF2062 family)
LQDTSRKNLWFRVLQSCMHACMRGVAAGAFDGIAPRVGLLQVPSLQIVYLGNESLQLSTVMFTMRLAWC